ncbi:MAG: hypothetical protein Q9207_005220 [Kuettlingeria erythrocarpa]
MAKADRSGTWYGVSTLRRGSKAVPVTQVAKESILAATDKASEIVTPARNSAAHSVKQNRNASPSIYLSRSLRGSNRSNQSLPIATSSKRVDISAHSPHTAPGEPEQCCSTITAAATENEASRMKRDNPDEKQTPDLTSKLNPARDTTLTKPEDEASKASNDISTWRGWFVRTKDAAKAEPSEPPTTTIQTASNEVETPIRRRYSDPSLTTSHTVEETLPRSWFGLWATTHSTTAGSADGVAAPGKSKPSWSSGPATPSTEDASVVQHLPVIPTNKSLGWAFWSKGASGGMTDDVKQSNQGELVIAESHSKTSPSLTPDAAETVSAERPCSMDTLRKAHSSQPSQAETESDTLPNHTKKQRATTRGDFSQANNISAPQNLLLPSIKSTYCSAPRLSLLQSLSRWWQDDRSSKTNRIQLLQNPPRIKRALAIVSAVCFDVDVISTPTGLGVLKKGI